MVASRVILVSSTKIENLRETWRKRAVFDKFREDLKFLEKTSENNTGYYIFREIFLLLEFF